MAAARAQERTGTLADALAHAWRMLSARPDLAAEQAGEILRASPGHPEARLLSGAALRCQGEAAQAIAVLGALAADEPRSALTAYEHGLALAQTGEAGRTVAELRRAVTLDPRAAPAWRALGDQLLLAGDARGADAAYAAQLRASTTDPVLQQAAAALQDGRLAVAERMLRERLRGRPSDVAAIRMLAELGTRLGRYADAEALLTRALELNPGFAAARHNRAVVCYRQGKAEEAVADLDPLLAAEPHNPTYRNLRAAALGRVGDYEEAIRLYDGLLAEHPDQPRIWMSYGHALKTAGRQADAIAAYRTCIRLLPTLGEAYWSLANLKTFRFEPGEVEAMRAALAAPALAPPELTDEDRLHLQFSLGKAAEDSGEHAAAFAAYAEGNRIRRGHIEYEAEETTALVARSRAVFTRAFFAERTGQGCPDPDPIFVVGLPRSGSTLVEQILASHSQVEGTMELPDIGAIARRLNDRKRREDVGAYPEIVPTLDAEQLAALGREFLDRTRVQRKTARPFFIDKMPNNFQHTGLIAAMLPNAKIIDARRHPMATCFSGFKQHFARGQGFTYDLDDLGRYYRDYVELMAHYDAVLPGRVHRVIYERMVEDTELEVRALLDHCGLPFEDACLRFHENTRAVRTASSEQVRRPIFRDAVDQWKHYEPWLGPLTAALGPVLDSYPDAPPIAAGPDFAGGDKGASQTPAPASSLQRHAGGMRSNVGSEHA